MDRQYATAVHEAGHAVVAHALGVRVKAASIRPGEGFHGLTLLGAGAAVPRNVTAADLQRDIITMPAKVRRALETNAAICLGGELAVELFVRGDGFYGPPGPDRELAEQLGDVLVSTAEAEALRLAEQQASGGGFEDSDPGIVQRATAHVGQLQTRYIAFLEDVVCTLLLPRERQVRQIAEGLSKYEVLPAHALERAFVI